MYLLPVAAVLLGAVLGHKFHGFLPGDQTLAAVLGGLAGAVLGLLGVKKMAARLNVHNRLTPVIRRVLVPASSQS